MKAEGLNMRAMTSAGEFSVCVSSKVNGGFVKVKGG